MKRWDTSALPVTEQYSYWRDAVCEAYAPLRPTQLGSSDSWERPGLSGWVDAHPLGGVNGTEIAACDQSIHHGRAEVARTDQDVVFVNLMLSGRCVVQQRQMQTVSTAGTFAIVDAAEPFRIDYLEDWRTISFRVPKADLKSGVPDHARGFTFSGSRGIGTVVADAMRSAWAAAPLLSVQQANTTGTAFTLLLESALQGDPAAENVQHDSHVIGFRESIERFVARNMPYADVSPAAIAARFAISVRKLHQLYETAPLTYGQTVMRIRVERCAEDLVATGGRQTLTAVAARWGFSDLSHLNRSFRRQFGMRPAQYLASRRESLPDARLD